MEPEMKAQSLDKLKALPLSEATAQDIQLELIRRWQYNAFDGERVAAKLWEHRDLWEAVMMDRLALSNPGRLPAMGLIKLRDLPYNEWNVDTLYILAPDKEAAKKLAEIFNMENWGGMVQVHDDPRDVDSALGGGREERAVVAIWWD
jgi:serine protease inhibitor